MLTNWSRTGALLTIVLASLASGCGGSGNSGSAGTNAANTGAAGAPASGTADGATTDAPKAITIAIGDEQKTLDMTQTTARTALGRAYSYAGTLTSPSKDGSKVTPGLAESWTHAGSTWKFKLRAGVEFSDGTPVTARDVVTTLNYLKNSKDNVNGFTLAMINGVRALSDGQVEITTKGPSPRLEFALSDSWNMIYPAAKLADPKAAKKFLAEEPISAGPFMVKSTSPTKTVLVANPNYWGPKPAIEQETWVTIPDAASRLAQVKSGQVDYADDLPAQMAPQLTGDVHPSYTVDAFGAQWLIMNTRAGSPTHSLQLREAISAAIDRKQISDLLYKGGIPAQTGVFPSTSEYADSFTSSSAEVDKAKALVAKSGCKAPCSLKVMYFTSSPAFAPIVEVMAQQLDEVGIKLSLEPVDDSIFYDRAGKGNFDLILTAPYGEYAEDYINYLLPSDAGGAGTNSAWTGADPYKEKWQRADGPAFKTVLDQVLARIHADKPFVPVVSAGYMGGSRLPDTLFSQSPTLYFMTATKS